MLPQFGPETPSTRMGAIIHGFAAEMSSQDRLQEMRSIVTDLVALKKVGALFLTDLEIGKGDVYSRFSNVWEEFVAAVAEAGELSNKEENLPSGKVKSLVLKNGLIEGFVAKIVQMGGRRQYIAK
jgi:hypothetical protein